MSLKQQEPSNIVAFRKKNTQFNIGLLIFGILFLYLIVTVFTYVTKTHVARYEVREGTILKDNSHSGLILREETLVYAGASGYINYYIAEGSKAAVGSNVYLISSAELDLKNEVDTGNTQIDAEENTQILLSTQNFVENYSPGHFSEVYALKSGIDNILQNKAVHGKQSHLDALIGSNSISGLQLFRSFDDGVVVFSRDGFEDLTASTVTLDHLNKKNYQKEEFQNNRKVSARDPVYKLITSENWTIVTQLSPDTAKTLLERGSKSVKIKMLKDNEVLYAKLKISKREDVYFAYLTLDNSMVRYATDRYIDFELITDDQTGLKIPKSSVVEKEFFVIPTDYITQSGKTRESGVIRESAKKNGKTEFIEAAVYYEDENEGLSYLRCDLFKKGDVILEPESDNTYVIGETRTLSGVYNINKGYAVFKQIEILAASEEYYIIRSGSSYGLSNYDQIALRGNLIKENTVVLD